MLRDPKSFALVENFAGQWLQFKNIDVVRPDLERFPDFDDGLRQAMRRETELFFESIIREDRSVLDLLDANYTFVNERLARFYGIPGVTGPEFRKVDVSGTRARRRHSGAGQRAHRVFVFHADLAGAARQVDPGESAERSASAAAARRAAARRKQGRRRRDAAPADGRASEEPSLRVLPFADGPARLRPGELRRDRRVADARTAISRWIRPARCRTAGRSRRPAELKAILKQDREVFVRALTEKLLIYALGRGLERYDRPALDAITADCRRRVPVFTAGPGDREQSAVSDEKRPPGRRGPLSAKGDDRNELYYAEAHQPPHGAARHGGRRRPARAGRDVSGVGRRAEAAPRRLAVVYVPNGIIMKDWKPEAAGADFAFTRILKPLEPFPRGLTVLSGLANHAAEKARGGGHAKATGSFLSPRRRNTPPDRTCMRESRSTSLSRRTGERKRAYPRSSSAAKTRAWWATATRVRAARTPTRFPGETPTRRSRWR